jgi:hypothetical protein
METETKKENKVISYKNLPSRFPLIATVSFILACDYYNAAEWVWTIVIILLSLGWINSIYRVATQKTVDIFKSENK